MGIPRLCQYNTVRLAQSIRSCRLDFILGGWKGHLGHRLSHFSRWPLIIYYGNKMDLFDLRKRSSAAYSAGAFVGYLFQLLIGKLA
jgi:hypothetical protein